MLNIALISEDLKLRETIDLIMNEIEVKVHIRINREYYEKYEEWMFKSEQKEDIIILDAAVKIIKKGVIQSNLRNINVVVIYRTLQNIEFFFELTVYKYIEIIRVKSDMKSILLELYNNLLDTDQYIELMSVRKYQKIKMKDIIYITRDGKNTILHTRNGQISYRISLIRIYNMLDNKFFAFIDKGCIINFTYIEYVNKNEICLYNDIRLPISRNGLKKINMNLK